MRASTQKKQWSPNLSNVHLHVSIGPHRFLFALQVGFSGVHVFNEPVLMPQCITHTCKHPSDQEKKQRECFISFHLIRFHSILYPAYALSSLCVRVSQTSHPYLKTRNRHFIPEGQGTVLGRGEAQTWMKRWVSTHLGEEKGWALT